MLQAMLVLLFKGNRPALEQAARVASAALYPSRGWTYGRGRRTQNLTWVARAISLFKGCRQHWPLTAAAASDIVVNGAPCAGIRSAFGAQLVRNAWQVRARAVGLQQNVIARLLGMTPEYVSIGIRAAPPRRPIVAIITAWEVLSPAQRVDWLDMPGIPRRRVPRWAQRPAPVSQRPVRMGG